MSGIFGIFNRNRKPVDKEIVNTMLDAISYWEPDDRGIWTEGPVALGHTMLWNTPESKLEHLPNKQDHLVITMDARLDNREELVEKFDMTDRPLRQITDSDFILAAYRKWGEECPKYLLGDFAFVIWDEKKQQLFCARDHIGIKPFYYHLDGERFLFCNDIKGLTAYPNLSKSCNDEAVSIYLSVGELWHPSITFFESIEKLPPATSMTITHKEVISRTYWRVEESPKINFNSLEAYSKKLRELLEEAVQARLRTVYPVASHLSGGLDSSTVAVLAARSLSSQHNTLKVYNWVPSPEQGDDPSYFEWANSRKIAELENIDHYHIELDAITLSELFLNHDIAMNDTVDLWYEFLVRKEACKANVRTMLSGWGGDELISYNGRAYFADIFRQGKILTALKGIWQESHMNRKRWRRFAGRCYRELLLPLLPSRLHCHFPKVLCSSVDYPLCTQSAFAQLVRKKIHPEAVFVAKKDIRTDQLNLYRKGHIVNRVESWAASAFKERIEYSYPLLDKRIVEFALGMPPELYRQKGKGRFLFRQAISGLLPEDIQWGNFKLEPKRVSLFLEIGKEALKLWRTRFKEERKGRQEYYYVDPVKLQEEISRLVNLEKASMEERIEVIESIEKSIFVLNLGCCRSHN